MYRIRRENGFDLSGPEKPWGEFTAAKGVSYKMAQSIDILCNIQFHLWTFILIGFLLFQLLSRPAA